MTTNRNAERDARDLLFIFKQPGVFGSSFPFNTAISWHAWNSECCLINHHVSFLCNRACFCSQPASLPNWGLVVGGTSFFFCLPPHNLLLGQALTSPLLTSSCLSCLLVSRTTALHLSRFNHRAQTSPLCGPHCPQYLS